MKPQTIWIGGSYAAALGLPPDAKVPVYTRDLTDEKIVPSYLESSPTTRDLLLDTLRKHPGSSTLELTEMTGLKRGTARNALDRMRRSGEVVSTLTRVPSEWRGVTQVSRWKIAK